MLTGIPKEIKNHQYRVELKPNGASILIRHGHQVIIENNARLGAGFDNEAYLQVGASIVGTNAARMAICNFTTDCMITYSH